MAVTYRLAQAGGALQNPAYRLADIFENEGFGATRRTPRHIVLTPNTFALPPRERSSPVPFAMTLKCQARYSSLQARRATTNFPSETHPARLPVDIKHFTGGGIDVDLHIPA
jgi:hypothetical protein